MAATFILAKMGCFISALATVAAITLIIRAVPVPTTPPATVTSWSVRFYASPATGRFRQAIHSRGPIADVVISRAAQPAETGVSKFLLPACEIRFAYRSIRMPRVLDSSSTMSGRMFGKKLTKACVGQITVGTGAKAIAPIIQQPTALLRLPVLPIQSSITSTQATVRRRASAAIRSQAVLSYPTASGPQFTTTLIFSANTFAVKSSN